MACMSGGLLHVLLLLCALREGSRSNNVGAGLYLPTEGLLCETSLNYFTRSPLDVFIDDMCWD